MVDTLFGKNIKISLNGWKFGKIRIEEVFFVLFFTSYKIEN